MAKKERKEKASPTKSIKTDIPLKLLLKTSSALFPFLFNDIPREIPFSLPTDYHAIFERKPDFLGQIGEKTILHIELETLYKPEQIPQRMLLYNYLIFTHFSKLAKEGKFPKNFILKQKILYIGERENIPEKFTYKTEDVEANFSVVRLNQISAETIFENGNEYDKLLSILAKLPKGKEKKFLNYRILKKTTIDLAWTSGNPKSKFYKQYGMGWRIWHLANGKNMIYHAGWWHGYNTLNILLPHENFSLIILSNKRTQLFFGNYRLLINELFPGSFQFILHKKKEIKKDSTKLV